MGRHLQGLPQRPHPCVPRRLGACWREVVLAEPTERRGRGRSRQGPDLASSRSCLSLSRTEGSLGCSVGYAPVWGEPLAPSNPRALLSSDPILTRNAGPDGPVVGIVDGR
jgi:hypothetical protein